MENTLNIPPDDLPIWMRQANRPRDWGWLLVTILCLLAAWPFITNAGLATANATENHLFMAADFSQAMLEGRLYPRWSPHTFNGYGAPVPNYYPPAAPYLTAIIKVLFTDNVTSATRAVFISACFIAGLGLYGFMRQRQNAHSALLAVVLYLYSPYFGFTAPYIRGDLSELLALAIVPMFWCCYDQLCHSNAAPQFFIASLLTAALWLSHPQIAIVASVLLLALLASTFPRSIWIRVITGFVSGTGLAAFYWLPALAEQNLVAWVITSAPHHLTLQALFQPMIAIDPAQQFPDAQFTFGLPLLLALGIAAFTTLFYGAIRAHFTRFSIATFLLIAGGLYVTPQHVWLLGLASLTAACAASAFIQHVPLPHLLRPSLIALLLISLLPVQLAPIWTASTDDPTPLDQIQYEQQTGNVAVLPQGYSVPTTLSSTLSPNRFLLAGYQTETINRVTPPAVGNRTQLNLLFQGTHTQQFQLATDISQRLSLLIAYFPGWQAYSSRQQLQLSPNPTTNLIDLQVPAMRGDMTITLGPTPLRKTAWLIALTSGLVLFLITQWRNRTLTPQFIQTAGIDKPSVPLYAIAISAFALIVMLFTTPGSLVTLYSQPGYQLASALALRHRTAIGLEAIAYQTDTLYYRPGDIVEFTLYWQALRPLTENYQVQTYLIEQPRGTRWYPSSPRLLGGNPTRRWRTYRYVNDDFSIALDPTTPPGEYQVAVEVLNCTTSCQPIDFFNASGQYAGQTLILPHTIHVLLS